MIQVHGSFLARTQTGVNTQRTQSIFLNARLAVCFGGRGLIERNKIVGNKGVGVLLENEAEPKVVDNVISDVRISPVPPV